MRQEFLIILYYLGPNFFPALLHPHKPLSTASLHTTEETGVVCQPSQARCRGAQDAPGLTLNLFWFIQDSKDRGPPQSTEEWWHNLWCAFAFKGTELGEQCPEAGYGSGDGRGAQSQRSACRPSWWPQGTGERPEWDFRGQRDHSKGAIFDWGLFLGFSIHGYN